MDWWKLYDFTWCYIGDHAVIGAESVVIKNVPANTVAVGNPAKIKEK